MYYSHMNWQNGRNDFKHWDYLSVEGFKVYNLSIGNNSIRKPSDYALLVWSIFCKNENQRGYYSFLSYMCLVIGFREQKSFF